MPIMACPNRLVPGFDVVSDELPMDVDCTVWLVPGFDVVSDELPMDVDCTVDVASGDVPDAPDGEGVIPITSTIASIIESTRTDRRFFTSGIIVPFSTTTVSIGFNPYLFSLIQPMADTLQISFPPPKCANQHTVTTGYTIFNKIGMRLKAIQRERGPLLNVTTIETAGEV